MFWGLTPALDLLEEYKNASNTETMPSELNILIVGGVDCRHIFKTLARRYRHQKVKLNFYLVEVCMEMVAKQLLLLDTALQPQDSMGLDQKTKVFMELYGNTLVRPYTAKYLSNVGHDMVKMVTDYDYLKFRMPFVTVHIQYKERDYLENLIKFWCGKDVFNIVDCWDKRLRKFLGTRYDTKVGAFDWDLHMRMHLVGGKQVCNQEYRTFRQNGLAFSWVESEVSRPNRSLVCAILPNGESFVHYGYLGDMETGPFVTYGLECEDKEFLRSANGQNTYRATDVTERNLKQIFYEIEHQKPYEHTKTNDMQLGCAVIKLDKLVVDIKAPAKTHKLFKECIKLKDVTVNFLSIHVLVYMKCKEKYTNFFDIVYFANNYLKHFNSETVDKISKQGSLLLIEHQLFVLSKRKKDLEEYAQNVNDKTAEMNLKKIDFNVEKDSYFKFILRNKNENLCSINKC